jgi:hypothetical protein
MMLRNVAVLFGMIELPLFLSVCSVPFNISPFVLRCFIIIIIIVVVVVVVVIVVIIIVNRSFCAEVCERISLPRDLPQFQCESTSVQFLFRLCP